MRNNLRECRRAAKVTQAQLAQRLGITQQTVSKHEKGITTPERLALIRQYESELKTPASELFPDVFSVQ